MNSPLNKHLLIVAFIIFSGLQIAGAQPPGPPPGGMDMSDMVNREKQTLYKNITDLTDDQKMLLDGIYEEYATTMKQNFEEMRNNRGSMNPESMRSKMEALQEEKNGLIKDVLNAEQYEIYVKQTEGFRRGRRGQGPPSRDASDSTRIFKN